LVSELEADPAPEIALPASVEGQMRWSWFALALATCLVNAAVAGSVSTREGWSVPIPPRLESALAGPTDKPPEVHPGPVEGAAPYRRLPSGYGKLNLSDRQREAIYGIRGGYRAQIERLEDELEGLKKAEAEACRSALSAAQRSLLDRARDRVAAAPKAGP
jgi:hypothetical protein